MTIARRRTGYAPSFARYLMAFAASALLAALVTDTSYVFSEDFIWADASDWLVSVGAIFGFAALVVALLELLFVRRVAMSWPFALAGLIAWLLSLINALFHTRDSYTSVYPWGWALSVLTGLAVLFAIGSDRRTPAVETITEEQSA